VQGPKPLFLAFYWQSVVIIIVTSSTKEQLQMEINVPKSICYGSSCHKKEEKSDTFVP